MACHVAPVTSWQERAAQYPPESRSRTARCKAQLVRQIWPDDFSRSLCVFPVPLGFRQASMAGPKTRAGEYLLSWLSVREALAESKWQIGPVQFSNVNSHSHGTLLSTEASLGPLYRDCGRWESCVVSVVTGRQNMPFYAFPISQVLAQVAMACCVPDDQTNTTCGKRFVRVSTRRGVNHHRWLLVIVPLSPAWNESVTHW